MHRNVSQMEILVTGAAGFIGFHLCIRLLEAGFEVTGFDHLDATDPLLQFLQRGRLDLLHKGGNFHFVKGDIRDAESLRALFNNRSFSQVIHLAARTGVRESFEKADEYFSVNVEGAIQIAQMARLNRVGHFIFASSSSVYGESKGKMNELSLPSPISPYGQSKMRMEREMKSLSESEFFVTGVRPFSVYGSWGRPDMAYFKYANQIANGVPIELFHQGAHLRDFTFVEDVVEGLFRIVSAYLKGKITSQYDIFNLGRGKPEPVTNLVRYLENNLGKKAKTLKLARQRGDAEITWASCEKFQNTFDFSPQTKLSEGINQFVKWWVPTLGNKK